MRRTVLAAVAIIALSGCLSARNVTELRTLDAGNRFMVQQDYETAYGTVLDKMRECWQTSFFMGVGLLIEHEIRPSKKNASVSAMVMNTMGPNSGVVLLVDFHGQDGNRTDVNVYADPTFSRSREHRDRIVREWIEGTKTNC